MTFLIAEYAEYAEYVEYAVHPPRKIIGASPVPTC